MYRHVTGTGNASAGAVCREWVADCSCPRGGFVTAASALRAQQVLARGPVAAGLAHHVPSSHGVPLVILWDIVAGSSAQLAVELPAVQAGCLRVAAGSPACVGVCCSFRQAVLQAAHRGQ